jgi:ABC-type multidrug transport system fused ATPase/permease subunit
VRKQILGLEMTMKQREQFIEPQFRIENTEKPSIVKFVLYYLGKESFTLFAIAGLSLANAMLSVSFPLLLSKIIVAKSITNVTMLRLLGSLALRSFITVINTNLLFLLGENIVYRIKSDLFAGILMKDIGWFDSRYCVFDFRFENDILNRLEADSYEFKHILKQFVSLGLKSFFEVTGSVVSLFTLNSKLSLIISSYLPLIYIGMSYYGFYLRALSKTR